MLKASNGREALEVEAQYERPIQALVTDVVMPEMGGIESLGESAATDPASGFS